MTWVRKHPWRTAAGTLFSLVVLFGVYLAVILHLDEVRLERYRQHHACNTRQHKIDIQVRRGWNIPAPPEVPPDMLGEPPETPELPPLPDGMSLDEQTLETSVWIRNNWLLPLVKTFPDDGLGWVYEDIEAGKLGVVTNFNPEIARAGFGMFPKYLAVDSTGTTEDPASIPGIGFLGLVLAELLDGDPDSIRKAWIMFWHESIHYRQYLEQEAEKKRTGKPTITIGYARAHSGFKEEACMRRLEEELEATREGCDIAIAWGNPELGHTIFPICRASLDETLFRQYYFAAVWERNLDYLPECIPLWAEAVGHPRPEAFEYQYY